eukprot:TRINITY_DN48829_c0_g1_i1.p1 TRINITY_DN48829_c0_g1~~TRINITY_DN48829_c0_g1_i1.p1  ORF type:complete len:187 (-),score=39.83 TRINITY_DN48829_c0_g1_i1:98-658(-)
MRKLFQSKELLIPSDVTVSVKSRVVTVTGTRGTLVRDFRHIQSDIKKVGNKIVVEIWLAKKKHLACARTIVSHIKNMIVGVTSGFEYHLRAVSAHFPCNISIVEDGNIVEIRNFLGQKALRRIKMLDGCKISEGKLKDELVIIGNNKDLVSQSAANIQMSCRVREKDIRKFLDGIYVSEKKVIGEE